VPRVDVKTGDTITFLSGITVRGKAETGFDRDTAEVNIRLPNGKEKPLTVNRTSQKALSKAFGDESDDWKSHKAKVTIVQQQVRDQLKDVIYLEPIVSETGKQK